MGLDFGSKTVGVAISDPLLITAQGIEIIRRKEENKLRQTLARIEELILEMCIRDRGWRDGEKASVTVTASLTGERESECISFLWSPGRFRAVSYTHLDVYKRQMRY